MKHHRGWQLMVVPTQAISGLDGHPNWSERSNPTADGSNTSRGYAL